MRNVESGLLAKFDLTLDHRKISVAQTSLAIPSNATVERPMSVVIERSIARGEERILFRSHRLESKRPHGIRITVTSVKLPLVQQSRMYERSDNEDRSIHSKRSTKSTRGWVLASSSNAIRNASQMLPGVCEGSLTRGVDEAGNPTAVTKDANTTLELSGTPRMMARTRSEESIRERPLNGI